MARKPNKVTMSQGVAAVVQAAQAASGLAGGGNYLQPGGAPQTIPTGTDSAGTTPIVPTLIEEPPPAPLPTSSGTAPSGGGGSRPAAYPPPPPAPVLPTFRPMTSNNWAVKVAPSDIIQFDDSSVEIALIQDLVFEDIGATELANMSRADLIDGQETIYSPIKNLSTVRREFNPNNIIATSFTLDYFSRFGIDILSRGFNDPYFNDNGDLVIEIESIEDDEEIQVEIVSSGTIDVIEEL